MLTGRGVSLESQFRLTYSMILNLLRVEDLKVNLRHTRAACASPPLLVPQVEDMLKRSFAEWRAQRSQPKAQGQLAEISK